MNADCEVGNYCDTATGRCTFDCRQDKDCAGGNVCSSLGKCVPGSSSSSTDGGDGGSSSGCACAVPASSFPAGALLLLAAFLRRRASL